MKVKGMWVITKEGENAEVLGGTDEGGCGGRRGIGNEPS